MKKTTLRGSITKDILEPVLNRVGGLGDIKKNNILSYCEQVKGLRQISEVQKVKGIGKRLGDAIKFAYENYYYGI